MSSCDRWRWCTGLSEAQWETVGSSNYLLFGKSLFIKNYSVIQIQSLFVKYSHRRTCIFLDLLPLVTFFVKRQVISLKDTECRTRRVDIFLILFSSCHSLNKSLFEKSLNGNRQWRVQGRLLDWKRSLFVFFSSVIPGQCPGSDIIYDSEVKKRGKTQKKTVCSLWSP